MYLWHGTYILLSTCVVSVWKNVQLLVCFFCRPSMMKQSFLILIVPRDLEPQIPMGLLPSAGKTDE